MYTTFLPYTVICKLGRTVEDDHFDTTLLRTPSYREWSCAN